MDRNFRILFVLRSSLLNAFSIERVFEPIIEQIGRNHRVEVKSLPFKSSSFLQLALNSIWYAWQSLHYDFVYMTGDSHYALLISPRRNSILTIHDCIIM